MELVRDIRKKSRAYAAVKLDALTYAACPNSVASSLICASGQADKRDSAALDRIFASCELEAVIKLAVGKQLGKG